MSSDLSGVLMWEKMVRNIGARYERQKNALNDTELQLKAAQKGLEDARQAASQVDLVNRAGKR